MGIELGNRKSEMTRTAVIKAATLVSDQRRIQPLRTAEEMRQACEILEAARARAAAVIQEAQAEADSIRRTAQEEGARQSFEEARRQGLETGRDEALAAAGAEFAQQHASLVAACRELMQSLESQQAGWQAAARQDLVDLALAIASRVARHVGERDRTVVLANLEEAVRLVGARSDVIITVNPADAEAARSFAQSLLDDQKCWQHVRISEAPELAPGGCRVQWAQAWRRNWNVFRQSCGRWNRPGSASRRQKDNGWYEIGGLCSF
jgi:flagellar biosynthesis/type III secretory pathway protein FliH